MHILRSWLNKCGDRELLWLMLALTGLIVFGFTVMTSAAAISPSDWKLTTVVAGPDTAPDVEKKLGLSARRND